MFQYPAKIIYGLPEQIGNYDLFVGRKKEFDYYLGEWYEDLERNFAQSQAIVARRKKGKTAFLQRYFNLLWSQEASLVIPFYFSVPEVKMTQADFSKAFFATFASQYLSYFERKERFISHPMKFEELERTLTDESFKRVYGSLVGFEKTQNWGLMWDVASRAPFEIAASKGLKIVQIIDEFQNINQYVYDQNDKVIDSMSGSYLELAEKKEAPLMISGSEVHGLIEIIQHLTGRFRERTLENLPEEEAKEAIRRYADFKKTKINETAKEKIWNLTQGDPLYIKALFMSEHNTAKDYIEEMNIIEVYQKEITSGEIYHTWMEYILKIFGTVNERNAKRIMLYLFQIGEERTRTQIIKDLGLDMADHKLEQKLYQLIKADLISFGETGFDYKIPKDKTYELVFRRIYEKEITYFVPDIRKELRKEMGKTNYEKGKFREFLVRERLKKPFNLKDLAENAPNLRIDPEHILEREKVKIGVREREIDLIVRGNFELWIDIKDTQIKYGQKEYARWLEIKRWISKEKKEIIFSVYSQSGYTRGLKEKLASESIWVIQESSKIS